MALLNRPPPDCILVHCTRTWLYPLREFLRFFSVDRIYKGGMVRMAIIHPRSHCRRLPYCYDTCHLIQYCFPWHIGYCIYQLVLGLGLAHPYSCFMEYILWSVPPSLPFFPSPFLPRSLPPLLPPSLASSLPQYPASIVDNWGSLAPQWSLAFRIIEFSL